MRRILTPICTAAGLLAGLGLAACDDSSSSSVRITSRADRHGGKAVLKVIDALQCPETQGDLTRKGSAMEGGAVCTYVGPRGAEVALHLIALDGEPAAESLDAFEARLRRDLPHAAAQLNPPAPPPAAAAPPAAAGDRRGDASVRLPGLRVETSGDKASVRIGGIRIEADDGSGDVAITSTDDSVSIQSHGDAAQIRTRATGEATRTTYLLTDKTPSEAGWRLVGFEARGPAGGPIVVATVRSKDSDEHGVFDDAKALVTLNVGR